MAHLYNDSKYFVDQKLRYTPSETLARFTRFMAQNNDEPSREGIQKFVNETFDDVGLEFEDWIPGDWSESPGFLENVVDDDLREFGAKVNDIWKILGRKIKEEVVENLDLYSLIWVPNPFIVPGGRFREYYYWDSYWIVQGLLVSGMHNTTKGMLENLIYLVDTLGHIPNGGRVYYLARSQLPLLIPMVKLYMEFTNDTKFLEDNIVTLEKEFDYWMLNHTFWLSYGDEEYLMAVYGDQSYGPRPESYREDTEEAYFFNTEQERVEYYSEKKAGSESGMDYSSRWFIRNGTNQGNLTDTKVRYIVPVDLNSVLQWNARLLVEFYTIIGDTKKVSYYSQLASTFLDSIETVLWDEEVGCWLDYDIINKKRRNYYSTTNVAPLWTGAYNKSEEERIAPLIVKYLKSENITFPGGVPTTLENTGEQWDYPNAWPPLVHMIIVGLNNTENSEAKKLAFNMAEVWIRANYIGYNQSEAMYEKYDVETPGKYGGGGEYVEQIGFGWTNGVVIDFLYKYGSQLRLANNI